MELYTNNLKILHRVPITCRMGNYLKPLKRMPLKYILLNFLKGGLFYTNANSEWPQEVHSLTSHGQVNRDHWWVNFCPFIRHIKGLINKLFIVECKVEKANEWMNYVSSLTYLFSIWDFSISYKNIYTICTAGLRMSGFCLIATRFKLYTWNPAIWYLKNVLKEKTQFESPWWKI